MATRREFLATQFEITGNDKAGNGIVASTMAMGNDTVEGMLASDNLFLRKLARKALELQNATLPDNLVKEKVDWEKAIVTAEKTVKKEYLAFEKESGKKETALIASKMFSETEIDAMLSALLDRFEQGQIEIQGRLETAKGRIVEIDLFPSQAINDAFLDLLYTPVTPGNGRNGTREPVKGKVWKISLDGVFFYVAIESGNKYRIYNSAHTLIKDNTDFPGESINSRTRAKKICYIGHYKGWDRVSGQSWGKVKSGGVAGTSEHSEIENFVIA